MATVIDGSFEWDDSKEQSNIAKHGVSFRDAQVAIVDPNARFFLDPDSDPLGEPRYAVIGLGPNGVLVVAIVDRGTRERIISARPADMREKDIYYGQP